MPEPYGERCLRNQHIYSEYTVTWIFLIHHQYIPFIQFIQDIEIIKLNVLMNREMDSSATVNVVEQSAKYQDYNHPYREQLDQ